MKHTRAKRLMAWTLSAALLITQFSAPVYAQAATIGGNLCTHHTEHINCGYTEGAACTHEHDENCGNAEAVEGTACNHIDNHDTACGYTEGTPCTFECPQCNPKDSGNVALGTSSITVTAFDKLEGAVQQQTVPVGTTLEELNLPTTLAATGFTVSDTKVVDSGTPSDTATTPAAISIDVVKWELDPTNENNQGNDTYDPEQGAYCFTPIMPDGYTLAESVALPEIWVMVGGVNLLAATGEHNISSGDLTIVSDSCSSSSPHIITGTTQSNKVVVNGGTHYITLDGVNINVSTTNNACAFELQGNAKVNLTLQGTNTLISGGDKAGLYVPTGTTLTIGGTGTLNATGGANSAGIGGAMSGSSGSITIDSGTVTANGGINAAGIGGGNGGSSGSLTITGGTVTANGGQSGAGIGGGYSGGGGTTTISGGTVTANGNNGGAGIGGGQSGSTGAFSTGTGSNAFIMATSISDNGADKKQSWSGVIFGGETDTSTGAIYSTPIALATDAEIPSGKTLTIDDGKTLTINSGVTLTNRGTITNSGTFTNNGTFNNYGTFTGTDPEGSGTIVKSSQVVVTFKVKTGGSYDGNPVTTAKYGDTIQITATASAKAAVTSKMRSATIDNVDFYLDSIADENKLGTGSVNSGVATLEITLNDGKWNVGNKKIIADFGGVSGSLFESTGEATLAVTKVDQTVTTQISYGNGPFTYGDAAVALTTTPAFSPSGAITYKSSDSNVISVDENSGQITLLKAGIATITATNAVANYTDATSKVELTVAKASQAPTDVTVSSNTPTYGGTAPTITLVTVGDSAPVTYTAVTDTTSGDISDVASINGTTITIKKVGTFYVKAVIGATTNYNEKTIYSEAITVAKGAAPILTDHDIKFSSMSGGSGTVDIATPLSSYSPTAYAIQPITDSSNIISSQQINNGILTFTVSTGAVGKTATIPVKVTFANYNDVTVNVKVTLADPVSISDADLIFKSETCPDGCDGHFITGTSTGGKIIVESGEHNITLHGVNIDVSGTNGACAFELKVNATVNLTLKGANTLKSGGGRAGLQVPTAAKLTIGGTGSLNATAGSNAAGIGGGYQGSSGTIKINGGTVTANGGQDAAGIGGGHSGTSGSLTITDGIVTAIGEGHGDGIGAGFNGTGGTTAISGGTVTATGGRFATGIKGTFSTGTDGKAFIVASTISDNSAGKKDLWEGVIFGGETDTSAGKVYGTPITLKTNAEIPVGKTLTIGTGKTLTINEGVTLTNKGTITIETDGTFTNHGIFNNYGTITNPPSGGTINKASQVVVTFQKGGTDLTTENPATYGDTITITATASEKTANRSRLKAAPSTVDFYLGSVEVANKLGTVNVNNNVATLAITLTGEDWKKGFRIGNNTITADFGGISGNLVDSTGTGTLTVNKATPTITAPTATAITYGKKLSDSTLSSGDASANGVAVEGTFLWTSGDTKPSVSDSETTDYAVTFTPKDTTNYTIATANIKIKVNPATLTITGGTVTPKAWDNSANATITALTFGGLVSGESLAFGTDYKVENAAFANAAVGNSKAITAGTATLLGTTTAKNYVLADSGKLNSKGITGEIIQATQAAPNVTFSFDGTNSNKLMDATVSMEYSLNGGTIWVACTENIDLTSSLSNITAANNIQIRMKETDTHSAGVTQTIDITKAITPTLGSTQPSTIGGKGSIPMTSVHEYSSNNGSTWTAATGTTTELAVGTYYVRVKATGTVLASAGQEITLNAFTGTPVATPTATFTATSESGGTLANVTTAMKYSVDGTNWNAITNTSMVITDVTTTHGVKIKQPGNGSTTTDSEVQAITVTKATTPALTPTQPNTIDGKGSIPMTSVHEYSSNNGSTWTAATGTTTELAVGTYYVRVKATGTVLASEAQTITLKEKANAVAPTISTNLATTEVSYTVGATSTPLSIEASATDGGTLSYEWFSNTTNSTTGGSSLTGATGKSYTPPTTTAGTTYYYCVVTNSITDNGDGGTKTATTTSKVANIKVNAAPATVTNVEVSPATASVQKGTSQQFNATVTGNNGPAQTVTWAVTGGTAGTSINDGLLTVAIGETATSLTVTATSTVDTKQKDTATVTVTTQPVAKYTLTVNGGTGSGSYEADASVSATANSASSGQRFKEWTATGITLANKTQSTITIIMPAEAVTLTAVYESIPAGSGTGGGGSSSTTTPPIKDTTPPTNGNVKPSVTVDGNGNATTKIPDDKVQEAINNAVEQAQKDGTTANGIVISVTLDVKSTANSLTAALSRPTLDRLIEAKVENLALTSGFVNLRFDLEALKQMRSQSTGEVAIKVVRQDVKKLSTAAQTAIGNRPAMEITASWQNNGKVANITNFGKGSIAIGIPYTKTATEQTGYLYGVYVDSKGAVTYITNSSFDTGSKMLMLTTNHLSVYGVGYKAPTTVFTDTAKHWAKDDIDFVAARGLLSGTGKTTFSPDQSMTRGMFVTALGRLAGVDTKKYSNTKFTDVKADAYYSPYVAWANVNSIVNGTTATTFSPDQSITRQEMAVMLVNYSKAIGYNLLSVHAQVTFTDSASIGTWAKDAVKQMQMAGILMGKSGNKFDPTATATRAEVSAMLRRYVELVVSTETAEGWSRNESGQWMYIQDGKRVTGKKTVDGKAYEFDQYGVTTALLPERKYGIHTVQIGESFWSVARKYKVSMFELATVNGKTIFSIIYAGEELKIPQK